jgi:hypothetical protein
MFMLTQLSTVKARLGIDDVELRYDALLTNAIEAVSARFDKECNRTLARMVDATDEFSGSECELVPVCYPIESVSKFELKTSEAGGWMEQTGVEYLIRRACVVSLESRAVKSCAFGGPNHLHGRLRVAGDDGSGGADGAAGGSGAGGGGAGGGVVPDAGQSGVGAALAEGRRVRGACADGFVDHSESGGGKIQEVGDLGNLMNH